MSDKKRIPIILCATEKGRACLFGYVDAEPIVGQPVKMYDVRMILYFARSGILGHASTGPEEETRMTGPVPWLIESTWAQCFAVSFMAEEKLRNWPNWK